MRMLIILHLLFFCIQIATSLETCLNTCGDVGPDIRFPFGYNASRCSYPGFNLHCNAESQAILTLPHSGSFIVQFVDYQMQSVYIKDPENCLARRFLSSFSLSGSPFVPEYYRTFTFLNCSLNSSFVLGARRISCLSGDNYTVMAVPTSIYENRVPENSCSEVLKTVQVPVSWPRWSDGDTRLLWYSPDCKSCEIDGGHCLLKKDSGLDLDCSKPSRSDLSRGAKYALSFGLTAPVLISIVGALCLLSRKIHRRSERNAQQAQASVLVARDGHVSLSGLDPPTIESYPRRQLGESGRLPKPNDNTCSICLSEYKPKENLRIIPECNHYFHTECIDVWLGSHTTCPLCRKSPDQVVHP